MAPLLDPKTNRDTAKAFEESLWTKGSVLADEFYKAPDNTLNAPPGTVLKVEANTDPALYALPPGTAISRIMYQSQTLGGAPVPVTSSPETYSQKLVGRGFRCAVSLGLTIGEATSSSNGGKSIGGPLLVIDGEEDPDMHVETTADAVNDLLNNHPTSCVEYHTLPGVTHRPALYASQRLWLDWIAARFAGVKVKPGLLGSKAPDFPRPLSCINQMPIGSSPLPRSLSNARKEV